MHQIIDHVALSAFEITVDLSVLHRVIAKLAKNFEDVLRPQMQGLDIAEANCLFRSAIRIEQRKSVEK